MQCYDMLNVKGCPLGWNTIVQCHSQVVNDVASRQTTYATSCRSRIIITVPICIISES